MKTAIKHSISAIFCCALSFSVPVYAVNFIMPELCSFGATGDGSENKSDVSMPEISLYYNSGRGSTTYIPDYGLNLQEDGNWQLSFVAPNIFYNYFVYVTYTPFLPSYTEIQLLSFSNNVVVNLPQAGYLATYASGYKLFKTITITITEKGGAYGFLEMAPELPGGGTSPYTLELDERGSVTVNCFYLFNGGNPYTLYNSEHEFVSEGTIVQTGEQTVGNALFGAGKGAPYND